MTDDRMDDLVAAGARERARAAVAVARFRRDSREAADSAASAARKAAAAIRWGGAAAVATGLLFRVLKLRRGVTVARWLWKLRG